MSFHPPTSVLYLPFGKCNPGNKIDVYSLKGFMAFLCDSIEKLISENRSQLREGIFDMRMFKDSYF